MYLGINEFDEKFSSEACYVEVTQKINLTIQVGLTSNYTNSTIT